MTLVCTSCDDEIAEESHWYEDVEMCVACVENSNAPMYCCGVMYSDGESACRSCGDPL